MTAKIRSLVRRRSVRTALLLMVLVVTATTMVGCNGYASVDIGAPLKVGPLYVNPSIGIGAPL